MQKVAIVTDGSSDIPQSLVDELGITILPIIINFEDDSYKTWGDRGDLSREEFYQKLEKQLGLLLEIR